MGASLREKDQRLHERNKRLEKFDNKEADISADVPLHKEGKDKEAEISADKPLQKEGKENEQDKEAVLAEDSTETVGVEQWLN